MLDHLRLLNYVLQTGAIAIILIVLSIGCNSQLSMANVEAVPKKNETPSLSTVAATDSAANPVKGKTLWNENACGACHVKNMRDDATGPALFGVTERWAEYPREDLYSWVKGSQQLLESGHPRAEKIWKKWGPAVMPNYPNLSDEEVEHLLAFVESR